MRNLILRSIFCIVFSFTSGGIQAANAIESKSTACKKMLASIAKLDTKQMENLAQYSDSYKIARKTQVVADNILQTRALLELYENDRTIYLLALENRKCFSKTELKNINTGLKNITNDANTVRSWIFAEIGIPGRNYYDKYVPFAKYLTTPQVLTACIKAGLKYKTMTCKPKDGNLVWIDSVKPSGEYEVYWPIDFIEGKSNWRDAAKRIDDFYKEFSVALSADGKTLIQFQKDHSYPGLFDFNSDPMLSACQRLSDAQNNVGAIQAKFTLDISRLLPDPNWVIQTSSNGELLVNQPLMGQVFRVPVKSDFTAGTLSIPGSYSDKHFTLIDGFVYKFSAC